MYVLAGCWLKDGVIQKKCGEVIKCDLLKGKKRKNESTKPRTNKKTQITKIFKSQH